jgi:hypothetical protein
MGVCEVFLRKNSFSPDEAWKTKGGPSFEKYSMSFEKYSWSIF